MLMSWNPGTGCRHLAPVIEDLGYHIVCIQEAKPEELSQINSEKWSWAVNCQQFVAARLPSRVEVLAGEDLPGKIRWSVFTVDFTPPGSAAPAALASCRCT